MPSRMKMKNTYNQVVFERRILFGCTILVGIAVCIWSVSIATSHWIEARSPDNKGLVIGDQNSPNGTKLFFTGHAGLLSSCTTGFFHRNRHTNDTDIVPYSECNPHDMFSNEQKSKRLRKPEVDDTLVNYARTDVSFAIISTFVMVMGFGFSIYTFRNPRYTFKRLAGGIHFITCACVMVVLQVFLQSVEYGSKRDNWLFPKFSELRHGYSFVLAWTVFAAHLISALAFMLYSRKRKRGRAATEELAMADEPTIMGR
ncbi:uncharacterized protein LOC106658944 [Trichogramma pretiosum]|uniref:uncharacterized protein LOC106658944 n=1 Tax=Trichogramma pretiosum TaxID=7493 RepID=UPI0006C95730|nr:uncharacterized protein LOC106658944 [Trichogramma pretiosum]XP_014236628.1 uncharacterized protein LOC106658944 [Trichogramma pretiosum]XP_014236629.1 uncharacterized protein LOC106658944 [Trichogramma pretiosum]